MRKTFKFLFLIIFSWALLSAFSRVEAATATISANKTSVTVGDAAVKVTVSVNAAAWNLQVSESATDSIVGFNSDAENQKTTKTYTIDTKKAGTYKVSLKGDITDGVTDANTKIDKSVTITVKEKTVTPPAEKPTTPPAEKPSTDKPTTPAKKSDNANLKTLGVTPKEYDFSGFSKDKTSYSVTVPNDVDSLKVSYKTEDSKATVKVTGNSGFDVGSANTIKVVVTAEDGKTKKTYSIKVTKLAADEEKPGNVIEDEKDIYLTSLELEGLELSPEFSKDVYSYTATLDSADTNKIKVNAKANSAKANIEITGNDNLVEGENVINIILTLDGSTEQIVYQVTVNKEAPSVEATTEDNTNQAKTAVQNSKKYAAIAIAVLVFIILAIIILSILLKRENRRLRDDDEDDDEEYNLYKEEVDKQTEEIFKEEDNITGQSVEYSNDDYYDEDPLEERKRRRGKHSR